MQNIAKHVHFVGIGGIGMSGLARILLGFNIEVSGSDVIESNMVRNLRAIGADVKIGHRAENVADNVDLLVYSSVIKPDNPEYRVAEQRGIKIVPRAELLAMIMAEHTGIAVAGAHGKTSTTGMLGTALIECEQNPTIIIGGFLPNIKANACWGDGGLMVAEADESDGTFLILPPKVVVVTNIENDHLDHYGTMENLIAAFDRYIHQIPSDGLAVLNLDSPIVAEIVDSGRREYVTYGVMNPAAAYRAEQIEYTSGGTISQIYHQDEHLGELHLNVPGVYNISNALAAIAVCHQLGLPMIQTLQGLGKFSGTGRRFEYLGCNRAGDIKVYDDYAHHPTEIKAVLSGAKKLGYKRTIGIFQPHRYSRTQLLFDEFAEAFDEADVVILNEIYSAFEDPIPGVNSRVLANGVKAHGHHDVFYGETTEDVLALLDRLVQPGDLVLIMGAGNVRRIGEAYAAQLADK